MSTIQLEITICKCCNRPVHNCRVARVFRSFRIPLEWYTEERTYPAIIHYEGMNKEVNADGSRRNDVAEASTSN